MSAHWIDKLEFFKEMVCIVVFVYCWLVVVN